MVRVKLCEHKDARADFLDNFMDAIRQLRITEKASRAPYELNNVGLDW
jgi:hypothetical protein